MKRNVQSQLPSSDALAVNEAAAAKSFHFSLLILFGVAFVFFLFYKLWHFNNLKYCSDLFLYYQVLNNSLHGHFFYENIYGFQLGIHAYLLLLLFLPVVALFKSAIALLVLWTLAYVSALFPVYAIVDTTITSLDIRPKDNTNTFRLLPFLVALLYLIIPNHIRLFNDSVYGFHPDMLFLPAIIWAFYFIIIKNNKFAYYICLAAILLIKEEMAVYMILFAFFLFLKKEMRKTALITLLISGVYFIGATLLIKHYSHYSYSIAHSMTYNMALVSKNGEYGDNVFKVGVYLLMHPWLIINISILKKILINTKSFLYISLLCPEILLLQLPKLVLMQNCPFLTECSWHFTQIYSFAFLAFVVGLHRLEVIASSIISGKYCLLCNARKTAHESNDTHTIQKSTTKNNKTVLYILTGIVIVLLVTAIIGSPIGRCWRFLTLHTDQKVKEISVDVEKIINQIDKKNTLCVNMYLLKYFENYSTVSFSQNPTIEPILRNDPDYFIVYKDELALLQTKVLDAFQLKEKYKYTIDSNYTHLVVVKKEKSNR